MYKSCWHGGVADGMLLILKNFAVPPGERGAGPFPPPYLLSFQRLEGE